MERPARKRLCVFCGSHREVPSAFYHAAEHFGRSMATHGYDLVYGGGNCGLMGTVANAVLAADGHVTGIIPESMIEWEVAHEGISDLQVVHSMSERKNRMEALSDAFVVLPGGLGTLDELFEMWTHRQLGHLSKPIALLNHDGFYDALLQCVEGMVAHGFVQAEQVADLIVSDTTENLLSRLHAACSEA